jgi:hypothetical protein
MRTRGLLPLLASVVFEFSMYKGGGAHFHEARVPLRKTWVRWPDWLQGHREWRAGCGG